jgi:hypothetical protein
MVVVAVEWGIATKQYVEDASSTPHIATLIIITSQYLGTDVIWGSRPRLHPLEFVAYKNLRKAKINNFKVGVCCLRRVQEVLWLEVSVHDILVVAIVKCVEYLLKSPCSQCLVKILFLYNSVKQLTPSTQLSN